MVEYSQGEQARFLKAHETSRIGHGSEDRHHRSTMRKWTQYVYTLYMSPHVPHVFIMDNGDLGMSCATKNENKQVRLSHLLMWLAHLELRVAISCN